MEFKYIKGDYSAGQPVDILFYTDVDYWSVNDFLYEFSYLEKYVNPSKIRIHINSVGGSVVDGMSVFSKIVDCKIPTECINDALAASMGSIIWSAGDEIYMKDYALLMIHNPFCDNGCDEKYNQATEAFTEQLKIVYMKRFGLSEDEVEAIMNGEEGNDGTFLTAQQCVEKGFIAQTHIIETPKAIKDQIANALDGTKDFKKICAVYSLMKSDLDAATKIKHSVNFNQQTMKENEINVFAALFGLKEDKATAENIIAQINDLKAQAAKAVELQANLDEVKAELQKANEDLQTTKAELTGAQSSVTNLTEDLAQTKEALQVYKDAEAKAQQEKVNALIQDAVKSCKISNEDVEAYTKMAQDNYDLAVNVLAKIPAREKLSKTLGTSNKDEAMKNAQTEEEKMFAKVSEVVGDKFVFRTLE